MKWTRGIRQVHRWVAVIFTLIVVLIFILLGTSTPPQWLYYTPLPFLFLLLLTGIYLFVLPYLAKREGP